MLLAIHSSFPLLHRRRGAFLITCINYCIMGTSTVNYAGERFVHPLRWKTQDIVVRMWRIRLRGENVRSM